jgi:hypothetical protein
MSVITPSQTANVVQFFQGSVGWHSEVVSISTSLGWCCRLPAVLKQIENSAASYWHLAEDVLLQQKQKALLEHKRLQAQRGDPLFWPHNSPLSQRGLITQLQASRWSVASRL